MDQTRENYEELLAARALGALPEPELQEVELALARDAELRAAADEMVEAAALLAYATDPVLPPLAVRSLILDSARIRTAAPREIKSETGRPAQNIVDFPLHAVKRHSGARDWLAAIAAIVIIAVLVGAVWIMWRRSSSADRELARSNQRLTQLEQQLAHERELRELLTSPDATIVALNSTAVSPAANAKFIYDRRTGRGLLVTDKLPVAPPGKAYQLWFIVDGKPIPSDVFRPDAAGRGGLSTLVPPEGRGPAVFAITLENDGGATAPQGQIYLKGAAS